VHQHGGLKVLRGRIFSSADDDGFVKPRLLDERAVLLGAADERMMFVSQAKRS
jgi:hypothetical protein